MSAIVDVLPKTMPAIMCHGPKDTVVIAGCGPLGLGMVAGARAKGPERIIALDWERRQPRDCGRAGGRCDDQRFQNGVLELSC
jgi:threonine dehydrogenase-like Zn-dependent dehydrogenase